MARPNPFVCAVLLSWLLLALDAGQCRADAGDGAADGAGNGAAAAPQGRYGLFNLLDSRSQFGSVSFPEPLLAEEGDLETETRTQWVHGEAPGNVSDSLSAEFEYSLGQFTCEVEGEYDWDSASAFDPVTHQTVHDTDAGFANLELAVRHPVFQWVSADGTFDDTVSFGMELAVPTRAHAGQQTELVPQAWNLLRVGQNLTLQTRVGYSTLIGAGEEPAGHETLEYSETVGYTLDVSRLHVPGLWQITPMVELVGEDPLNNDEGGANNLVGVVGADIGFHAVGPFQPKLGLGVILPMSGPARDEMHWGCVVTLNLDF